MPPSVDTQFCLFFRKRTLVMFYKRGHVRCKYGWRTNTCWILVIGLLLLLLSKLSLITVTIFILVSTYSMGSSLWEVCSVLFADFLPFHHLIVVNDAQLHDILLAKTYLILLILYRKVIQIHIYWEVSWIKINKFANTVFFKT